MRKKEQIFYCSKWFENATDTELYMAREKVRLDYCSSGNDFKAACSLQNLLGRFDKEMSKRVWAMKHHMRQVFIVNTDGIKLTMTKKSRPPE